MNSNLIFVAVAALGGLGIFMGLVLAVASKRFHVDVDQRVERVRAALPGANCGACGFPGCDAAAAAMAEGKAPAGACTAGGSSTRDAIAQILGVAAGDHAPVKTVVRCQGGRGKVRQRFRYDGVDTCQASTLTGGGPLACPYGCLGYGDCQRACPFDAITMGDDGLPSIDLHKCTRCGLCVKACPRKIIDMLPEEAQVMVLCISRDKGKIVKDECDVGCIACGICQKVCPVKAIEVVDNLAVINYDLCNSCGTCVGKCPTKCIISVQGKVDVHQI
jgi:Na+-translocating ferredoxin:NAD+ oxidoreductase RNF subunit RnfB